MAEKKALFDQIKDSLEQYEASYDPHDWTELKQRLDQAPAPGKPRSKSWLYTGIAGGLLALGAAYIMWQPQDELAEASGSSATVQTVDIVPGETESPTAATPVEATNEPVAKVAVDTDSEATPDNTGEAAEEPSQPQAAEEATEDFQAQRTRIQSLTTGQTNVTEPQVDRNSDRTTVHPTVHGADEASVLADLQPDFSVQTNGCTKDAARFAIAGAGDYASFFWEFGDGTTSNQPDPVHYFQEDGTFEVRLTVTALNGDQGSVTRTMTVKPRPLATFSWEDNARWNDYDPAILFSMNSTDVQSAHWSFGDRLHSNDLNPRHLYRKQGEYQVQLIAVNSLGCADTNVQRIRVREGYNLLAPTGFTPNGDNMNDTWIPRALESGDIPFTLTIFDQAGRLVYRTSDASRPWDGRLNGGNNPTQLGETFRWTAQVTEKDGTQREYGGTITIAKR
ncbi:MAG: PKD domain-containing protein [Bacteroidota bacterium]